MSFVDDMARHGLASRPAALLLDLSGNRSDAVRWAERNITEPEIWLIDKADLKWESKLKALKRLRGIEHYTFAVFTRDVTAQSMRGAMMLFAVLAGARRIVFGDASGARLTRLRAAALLLDAPRSGIELAFGYVVLVPLTWIITMLLDASQVFKKVQRESQVKVGPTSKSVLYVRATLSTATEGGMITHSSGFADGARALGHRLLFLVCGRRGGDQDSTVSIEPSTFISATRALYEVWNNLVFTVKSIGFLADRPEAVKEIDFIYQRYSRFNWAGVALSLVTGRPLLLEFNGSEVWVSKRWDPVGLLWLLSRFERLNLRAADLVFVVSDVERRNLLDAGIAPGKVIVNPNGVDTERFSPGCGGVNIRRELDIEHMTVIGFLGTFGPWHGAPVLAEAVKLVGENEGCHFLFIGDGDQRALTESIIESSGNGARATFTGRIPHAKAPAYLDACDILVSPHVPAEDGSEFFGSPTKLFEYMAMARPVIASRLGQIALVIADGENGLLVEPGDPRAIAGAITRLSNDGELCRELGAAARRTVTDGYTWRHNAERVFNSEKEKPTDEHR
jgi:glycosyltransferase involved in cell wall biosynthesis